MKLYVLSNYSNREYRYKKGDEIEVDDFLATYLFSDSPESFSKFPPSGKGMEAPPKDKMIYTTDYRKWKVADLKSALKQKGLSTSGKKDDLVERLIKANA